MKKARFLFCALVVSEASVAGGFALIEQGASGLGNAYAGAAAVSQDASTVWFNPAGMTEIKNKQLLVAGHVIGVNSEFRDKGTTLNAAFGGDELDSNFATASAVDASGTSGLPNLYYVHPLNKKGYTAGIGFSVPFGNSSSYDKTWVGRYQAVESSVTVFDINPSIAYEVNDTLSVGGGLSIQLLSAELGSAVDSGATCLGLVNLGVLDLAECVGAGLTEAGVVENDGYALTEGDGVEVSFNVGLLYKPQAGTKIGVAYRHSGEGEVDGKATFTNNAALESLIASRQFPLLVNNGIKATASLPSTLMFSGAHKVNDQVELLADATFSTWGTFDELRVIFDQPTAQPDSFNTLNFKNAWRMSAGLNYKHDDALTFRAGVAYDEDPVPSPKYRTARIPGNERVWAAFGVGYKVNKRIGVDVSFAHLMVDDTPIDNASEAAGGTTLRGVYETNANIISAQVNVQFN